MRIALSVALLFLIAPILATAQDSPPSDQPDRPEQSPAGTEELAPLSHATTDPGDTAIRISAQTQNSAFVSVRPSRQSPVAPGYSTAFNLSAGYSVTALGMPSSGRATLSGTDVGISVDSGRRFGAELNLGYVTAPNVFSSGHRVDVFSYLVGPVFHLSNGYLLNAFARFSVGGARVAGPFPSANGGWSTGYVHHPAWAGGGGAEYPLSDRLAFRVNVDYLRTYFFNSSAAIRGESGLRVVNSIVYYLGSPPIRRRR